MTGPGTTMEQIIPFGPGKRLFGLLAGTPTADAREVLVLLNAGTMPHIGPFRLYVDLARRLAEQGTPVFRLDLPGVGEAPLLSDRTEQEALASALDGLQARFGCTRFIVGGICSASDVAWRLSEADLRVTGLLLLDPVAYTDAWYWLARWREFVRKPPSAWWAALRRRLIPKASGLDSPSAGDFRDWPSRAEAHAHVRKLIDRGARMLVVFTGSASDRFRDTRQAAHSFGPAARGAGIEVHLWAGSDHLFYLRSYREKLMRTTEAWLRR